MPGLLKLCRFLHSGILKPASLHKLQPAARPSNEMAECALLNTGASIPLLGLGTADYQGSLTHDERKAAVSAAIEVGYRHFDTASHYKSESFLGEALKEAMQAGRVKREDLFVTSKLWCVDNYPEGVLPALKKSLSELQLDYLDLYLMHWPVRIKQGLGVLPKQDELLPVDINATWRAMEACVRNGLTKAIGVSNFSSKKLTELLDYAEIAPAVNQVEMHPMWQQIHLRETCSKVHVHVSAWSPLGAPNTSWGSGVILDNPIIKEIAAKHGKTPAQVVLRWGLDKGVSLVPKSYNKTRMAENLQVFGWSLTEEDHQNISTLKQRKAFDGGVFINPTNGPYKSLQNLWDGEI